MENAESLEFALFLIFVIVFFAVAYFLLSWADQRSLPEALRNYQRIQDADRRKHDKWTAWANRSKS